MVAGKAPGRKSVDEVTCFHNYKGLGLQFAAIGAILYKEAQYRQLGHHVEDRLFSQSVHP